MRNITSSKGGHKPSSFVTNFETISFEGPCLRENKKLDKAAKKAFSKPKKSTPVIVIKSEDRPVRRFIQKTKEQNKINYKTLKGLMKKASPLDLEILKGYGFTVTQLSKKEVLKHCFKATMFNCNGHVVKVTQKETI